MGSPSLRRRRRHAGLSVKPTTARAAVARVCVHLCRCVRVHACVCGSVGGWGEAEQSRKTQSDSVEGLQAALRRRQGHIRSWNRLTNALRCSATVSERSNWESRWVFFPPTARRRDASQPLESRDKTEFSAVSLFHRKKRKETCLSFTVRTLRQREVRGESL